MSVFSANVEDKGVQKMISEMLNRLENPRPLLGTVGKYTQEQTQKMFVRTRPDNTIVRGKRWKKLKTATIFRKRQLRAQGKAVKSDRPLVRTGKLRNSLLSKRAFKFVNKGLIYGTQARNDKVFLYPAVHQAGSRSAKIPARKYLFLTRMELLQIAEITKNYTLGVRQRL